MASDTSDLNVVAVCQMTSTEDKAANMETVSSLVQKAAKLGAKVLTNMKGAEFDLKVPFLAFYEPK